MIKSNANIRLFFTVFIALNLTFLFYQIIFFWGNHDWDWVKGTTQILQVNTGLFEGRFAKFILNVALFGGQILPLLNALTAFALLALGQVMLVNYWQIKNPAAQILVALLPVLSPYILGWLFFPINILGNFSAVALITGGLILAEKKDIAQKFLSTLCLITALGVYPSTMEMMFICWSARQILIPQARIKQILPSFLTLISALIAFKLILTGLSRANFIYTGHYNMQTATLADMLSRLPQTLLLTGRQFVITLPFLPLNLKLLSALLVLLALSTVIRVPKTIFFWLIMLFATVLSTFLTADPAQTAYMPRVNFYGLNYLYTAAAAILFSQQKFYKNLSFIISISYLLLAINQDCAAQKAWHFGKSAEEKLALRVISRIEEKNPTPPLTPVIAGELPLRPRYYAQTYALQSPYLLNTPLMVRHIPSGMFNFYAQTPLFTASSQISHLTPKLYEYLKTASRPWPAFEGLYIDESYAILLLTPDGIKAIQAQLP